MSAKREAADLQKWMNKAKDFGKEPPRSSDAPYNVGQSDNASADAYAFEQLNLKVPKGTKLRLKRLGLEQGGLSMLTVFKRMLHEYEARHRDKQKG